MNRPLLHRWMGFALSVCLITLPNALQACATCFGASDSPMAQGMNWGIMSLLVVIAMVLGGIVSFFVYLGWRSSTHGPINTARPTSEN